MTITNTLTLTIAAGAISALFVLPAAALPLTPLAQQAGDASTITLVADGCGRGNVRIKGECYREVKSDDDEDQPRSRKRARNNDDEDDDQPRKSGKSRHRDNDRAGRDDEEDCPKGQRFSHSRNKCVEKTDPAAKAVIKLLFGSGNDRHRGNNEQQGNNGNRQGNAQKHSGACKPEPGCSCINGKLACH